MCDQKFKEPFVKSNIPRGDCGAREVVAVVVMREVVARVAAAQGVIGDRWVAMVVVREVVVRESGGVCGVGVVRCKT